MLGEAQLEKDSGFDADNVRCTGSCEMAVHAHRVHWQGSRAMQNNTALGPSRCKIRT